MEAVSADFLDALRRAHTVEIVVDAWRNGELIASGLEVTDGAVTVDSGSQVRRSLSLTLAPQPGLWDLLAPLGTLLLPRRGIRYPNGRTETVPLGVFGVDVQTVKYGPGGTLQFTAPDQWTKVQRGQFETPEPSVRGALIVNQIAALVMDMFGGVAESQSIPLRITATSTATMGPLVWPRDRQKAITDLASSIGAEAFLAADGALVIRDLPTLDQAPVWSVDASRKGVMVGADRTRSRQRTYNVVVATPNAVDGTVPFDPVIVADDDPSSPTWVGSNPRVPLFLDSASYTNPEQAREAAYRRLEQVRALATQLTLEAAVNPALEAGDVVEVLLPAEAVGLPQPYELHIIDSLTVPLTVGGTQSLTTRSTRPDDGT